MYIGAAYYPEFYSKEQWDRDIEMMSEIGFNVVRLAEFAWCRLEPREGKYDYSWLDEVIEKFAKKGIKTILGTPTGAPPQWLITKHPGILPVDDRGLSINMAGGFGYYCVNNPIYRDYTRKIVSSMADHYKYNPSIIMYQIDNEFMGNPCYCDYCREEYIKWVKKEHKTLEAYNQNLMTIFQGREIGEFDEITVPKKGKYINSSNHMDYKKFISHSFIEYCKIQQGAIRAADSKVLITSNYCSTLESIDYFEMAKLFDVAAFDVYPKADERDVIFTSYRLDLMRGLKKKNYWVLEQQCSPVAFRELNYVVEPMEARLLTYKSIAHGADGIIYFRWNATHSGGERFGAGILRHDNNKGRTYYEIENTCRELKKISARLEGSKKREARAAIVFSNLSIWAVESDRKISSKIQYRNELLRYYRYFEDHNVDVDFVRPGDDISGYQVILAPLMTVVTEQDAKWFEQYAENGGTLVFGYMSGIFNEYNRISSNYYQGELRNLLGIKVTEWAVPFKEQKYTFSYRDKKYPAEILHMIVESEGAHALAHYDSEFYGGTPSVTVNIFGKGFAYYIASTSNVEFFDRFIGDIMKKHSNVESVVTGSGVDIKERYKGDERLFIVMNPGRESKEVMVSGAFYNALTGEKAEERFTIRSNDVVLLTNHQCFSKA